MYGATDGRCFLSGQAGERFAVRNRCVLITFPRFLVVNVKYYSGAHAVVEGVGFHGCSYMTEGRVVVLGPVGENFASGMSGGIAYIYDPDGTRRDNINTETVDLVEVGNMDEMLQSLVQQHLRWTNSEMAMEILSDWENNVQHFVKVFPKDYRRVLRAIHEEAKQKTDIALERLQPKVGVLHRLHVQQSRNFATQPPVEQKRQFATKAAAKKKKDASPDTRPTSVEDPQKGRGFLEYGQASPQYKPAKTRVKNFQEIWKPTDENMVKTQAARCMVHFRIRANVLRSQGNFFLVTHCLLFALRNIGLWSALLPRVHVRLSH